MKRWLKYAFIYLFSACLLSSFAGTGILYAAEQTDKQEIISGYGQTETPETEQPTEAIRKKKNGWVTYQGERYYYKNRKLVTGWRTIRGKRYYFQKTGNPGGKMTRGWLELGSKKYYFEKSGSKKGQMVTGWKTIGGKKYYFAKSGQKKGQMLTGWQKIGSTYYYFKENGVRVNSKTTNSSRKGDKTGSAKQKTYRRAQAVVAAVTTPDMTKEQKLKTCFAYVQKYICLRPRTPHYAGADWDVVYANDMFLDGAGNCFSYASAFAYMAKACGYKKVYACNNTVHGWCEIDGKVYDPERYRNSKYKYYGTPYSDAPGYWGSITDHKAKPFKRIKI